MTAKWLPFCTVWSVLWPPLYPAAPPRYAAARDLLTIQRIRRVRCNRNPLRSCSLQWPEFPWSPRTRRGPATSLRFTRNQSSEQLMMCRSRAASTALYHTRQPSQAVRHRPVRCGAVAWSSAVSCGHLVAITRFSIGSAKPRSASSWPIAMRHNHAWHRANSRIARGGRCMTEECC